MKSKWLISMGLVVCLLMAFALPMCAPAPPPEEEELASTLKMYMAFTPTNEEATANFIKEKLGVTVKWETMSFGPLHARVIAEAPNFAADMVIGCGGPLVLEAKEKAWSVQYASPNWQDASPVFKDPDNYWWNMGNWAFVLIGNKDMLAEKGYAMPTSWDELLDPKWKGEIVMPSPLTSGTAFMMLYTFMTQYGFNADKGEEGGWEYFDALDKNVHHYTKGGNVPTDLVGRGEFMLGITADEIVKDRIDEGFPLVWTVPKEGTGYGSTNVFILKGTKELYTCGKVVDLLGTTEYLQLFSGLAGYVTKDPNVIPALYGEIPKYVPNIDLAWAYSDKERLCDEWKDKIGRVPAE